MDKARLSASQRAQIQAQHEFARLKAQERLQNPHIPPAPKQKKHGFCKFVLATFLIVGLVVAGLCFKVYQDIQTLDTYIVTAQSEPYELKEGATLAKVVRDLTLNQFHPKVVDLWVKLNHLKYPVIQKGPYLIDGVKSLNDILADMREGNIVKIKLPTVALVEGMTSSMILRRLSQAPELKQDPSLGEIFKSPKGFIKKVLQPYPSDPSLLEAIGGEVNSLEGLLMPATYEYVQGKTVTTDLVAHALMKMANFMRENYIERDAKIDKVVKNPYEVLILASLVERESSLPQERPLIAQVFINRLNKGIKLQTDPAVMYGVSPDFKGPLLRSQLRKDTPYNTYTRAGLPPTPIAMPSEESILAVLRPEATDALFFVAKSEDPKDGHYFSKTLKEHNKAVQAYRKAVREYKAQQALKSSQNKELIEKHSQEFPQEQSQELMQGHGTGVLDPESNSSNNSASLIIVE